ncbi:MAG: rhodanese-like domain-containing protein [Puniceicoccaceae bacterium]|nr:MAG: rhodanese-like domain-containing protein [Puniceicoccaceae bacterium]
MRLLLLLPLLSAAAAPLLADGPLVDARTVAAWMTDGERLTLVDLRPTTEYSQGSIPGAINVPARLVPSRQLPPLGRVVAFGDGLGRTDIAAALEALNAKPGIQAYGLRGGLAAWESAALATTHRKGVSKEELPMLNYDQLLRVAGPELLVIDLRKEPELVAGPAGEGAAPAEPPLTDLGALLPQARVVRPTAGPVAGVAGGAGGPLAAGVVSADPNEELTVLIDSGDGAAESMARRLRASGNRRVVVLAGGELILRHEGRAGLMRAGGGSLLLEEANTAGKEEP